MFCSTTHQMNDIGWRKWANPSEWRWWPHTYVPTENNGNDQLYIHAYAYFIFPVKGAELIRERYLFQLRVKHWGDEIERELVLLLNLKRYGFDISYIKRRNKGGAFICKYPN